MTNPDAAALASPSLVPPSRRSHILGAAGIAVAAALSCLASAQLFILAYDPDVSPTRRVQIVEEYFPLITIGVLCASFLSVHLGVRRAGSFPRFLLGPRESIGTRIGRVVLLGTTLGFVVPAVQRLMGGAVTLGWSRSLLSEWTGASWMLAGFLAFALQEELAIRALLLEGVNRLLKGAKHDRARSTRTSWAVGIAVTVTLGGIGVAHMPFDDSGAGLQPLAYSLLPRLLPACVLLWTYWNKGLLESVLLHALINVSTLVLVPATLNP